jgi:Ca2+-binding EF-hand superfamily protein
MGCALNSISSDENNSFLGTYSVYKRDFDAMQFQQSQLKRLYKLFLEIDEGQSGSIPVQKISEFFMLPHVPVLIRILNRADEQGRSSLPFNNMVVALWSICSLPDQFMGKLPPFNRLFSSYYCAVDYLFDLFDTDSKGRLSVQDLSLVIKEICSKNISTMRFLHTCTITLYHLIVHST